MEKTVILLLALETLFSCNYRDNPKSADKENATDSTSTQGYEFYGNYIPTPEAWIEHYQLKSIEINTKDSLGESIIKEISLRFSDTVKHEYYIVNTSFKGTKENFLISAQDSLLGKMEIRGRFLGKYGPVNDNITTTTIVFKGLFLTNNTTKQLECTFYEGD